MDPIAVASVIVGSAVNILCWAIPSDRVKHRVRIIVGFLSGGAVFYGVVVFVLTGVEAMKLPMPLWGAIAVGVLCGALLGGIAGGLAWKHVEPRKSHPPSTLEEKKPQNLIKNGGFESLTEFWGTGSVEERVRDGNHPEDLKRLPYVVGDKPNSPTNSEGGIDTAKAKSGIASFQFTHRHPKMNHRWGSLSQRIFGLEPDRWYVVTFWVSAENARGDSFFVTTDIPWNSRTYIPAGTYEWQKRTHRFYSGKEPYIDVRFVIELPCVVWLDDVSVELL